MTGLLPGGPPMTRTTVGLIVLVGSISHSAAQPAEPFGVRVVDAGTGRGVPLVELRTTNEIALHTDSSGWVAFDEPGLMGREVFFAVSSPGYEYPKDGFGYRGVRPTTTPGGSATVKLPRTQPAERLYRVTGQGIHHAATRLGLKCPIPDPNMAADVTGQDSVQCLPYKGKLFWLWGDTNWPGYPLGNF